MDIRKNRPENLAVLITKSKKKASAEEAARSDPELTLFSFLIFIRLHLHTREMREPAKTRNLRGICHNKVP